MQQVGNVINILKYIIFAMIPTETVRYLTNVSHLCGNHQYLTSSPFRK
jgi:hypothetical protein